MQLQQEERHAEKNHIGAVILPHPALAACGTKTYQVTTKSGQTYTANGSLDYDVKSETYKFKNEKGKEIILNQKDIEVHSGKRIK